MVRTSALGVFAAAMVAFVSAPASAQVRDAVYRGTLICDKLPFIEHKMREAISVTISRGAVRYSHVVRLRETAEPVAEEGTGTLNGQNLSLQGSWNGGNRQYRTMRCLRRRSAKLKARKPIDGGRTINSLFRAPRPPAAPCRAGEDAGHHRRHRGGSHPPGHRRRTRQSFNSLGHHKREIEQHHDRQTDQPAECRRGLRTVPMSFGMIC
jgi:hypothetical protein